VRRNTNEVEGNTGAVVLCIPTPGRKDLYFYCSEPDIKEIKIAENS
jgi:hypothetical protein